jgi:hypothetical protein
VLIARLTAQLRCYVPEPVDETWGRLRHLGARREQLIASIVSQVQQIRALLECVWPAALECAQQPFRSPTWAAATSVIFDRDGGDLNRTRRLGSARFEQAMRREIIKRGGQQACRRIVRKLFTALADSAGVLDHRRGALERVQLMLTDWVEDQRRLTDTEARMLAVLDQLQLTELVTSIHGVSAIRGCGDPGRDRRPAPVRIRPGPGQTRRPRARGKTVWHVRRPHQTHRTGPPRSPAGRLARRLGCAANQHRLRRPLPTSDQSREEQAHTHPGADRHRRCDPAPAARGHRHRKSLGPGHRYPRHAGKADNTKCCLSIHRSTQADGRGRAQRGIETQRDLDAHPGQPRPSSHQPDYTLPGQTPLRLCRDRRRTRQPTNSLTKTTYADERMFARRRVAAASPGDPTCHSALVVPSFMEGARTDRRYDRSSHSQRRTRRV